MPGGMVCTLCGRALTYRAHPPYGGHATWCPDIVTAPDNVEAAGWRDGYETGFRAASDHLLPDLVDLYRRQLGKLIATCRDAFEPAARVAPSVLLDAIEKAAERAGLL